MKGIITAVSLLFFLFHGAYTYAQEMSADFTQMVDWMTGQYTNSAQAAKDDSYTEISLKITQIWPEATTGAWLYVEKAAIDSIAHPFLQAVYFLSEISNGEYSVDIYAIPDAEKFVGAWKDSSLFAGKTVFDLKHIPGCALFLNYDGFQYSGKTNTGSCKTDSEKSEYSTTNIILIPGKFQIWKRGFNTDGKQVAGPTKSAYIFKKV